MRSGFPIGRVAGIQLLADWSLLIIFFLILVSLGGGVFPYWHPDWPAALSWLVALAAALLFFASVLLHELAHALVGRRQGASVPRITLFVFGGMAHVEREPRHWRGELVMAAVGPLTSLVIGVVCLWLGSMVAGPVVFDPDDPQTILAQLNAPATVLLWLGQINILLAVFNMVPGYPLDGGRVLRAIIWGVTGDPRRATRWAAALGQAFAWLLIAAGLAMMLGLRVPVFGGGFVGGLWIAFIGWFLNNAAIMSHRQQLITSSLHSVPVSRLMQTELDTVAPELPLEALVDEHVLRSSQRAFPVMGDGQFLGLVCLADLRGLSPGRRAQGRVQDIMTPRERLRTVAPDESADEVLRLLSELRVNQLPVLEQGRLIGLITREALLRWLALEGGQDDTAAART